MKPFLLGSSTAARAVAREPPPIVAETFGRMDVPPSSDGTESPICPLPQSDSVPVLATKIAPSWMSPTGSVIPSYWMSPFTVMSKYSSLPSVIVNPGVLPSSLPNCTSTTTTSRVTKAEPVRLKRD